MTIKVSQHAWLWFLCGLGSACQTTPPSSAAANAVRPVQVATVPVKRQDVPVYLQGIGNVAAFYTVTVRSQVDGRIERVLFEEGQQVQRGMALLEIDRRPFDIQLQQAVANLQRDQALLKNDQLNLQRNKVLRRSNLIAEQALTDQQALVDQLAATVAADVTQVNNAKLQLIYAQVRAPISGRTGIRLVDPGNLVHASDANGLVVLTQLDPIAVLFTLPEDNLPQLRESMRHSSLRAEAWSRDGNSLLGTGVVKLMDNQINSATGTIRLKAVFANPNESLWPNQFVKVKVRVKLLPQVLVVPTTAVQYGPHGTFVYVVEASGTAQPRPVQVSFSSTLSGTVSDDASKSAVAQDVTVLNTGVQAGEIVVTEGQYQLHPGSRVVSASHPAAAAP